MDVIMPKRDGISLMKRLANTKMAKRPVIIAHSVTGNVKIMEACYSAGAVYYLLKPQTNEAIADTIPEVAPSESRKLVVTNPPAAKQEEREVDLETLVTEFMHELGLPAHIKGYRCV